MNHFPCPDCGEPVRTRPLPDVDGIDNEVEIEQMPWMVSLGTFKSRNHWNHECGGSLITNRHVLTAAHCLVSKKGRSLKQYRQVNILKITQPFQKFPCV